MVVFWVQNRFRGMTSIECARVPRDSGVSWHGASGQIYVETDFRVSARRGGRGSRRLWSGTHVASRVNVGRAQAWPGSATGEVTVLPITPAKILTVT
jgi:hypothetical protein